MKFKLFSGGNARIPCRAGSVKRLLSWAKVLALLLLAGNSFGAVELQTLAPFDILTTSGSGPTGALVQGKDGDFYGTTSTGGQTVNGTIFKVSPSGKFSVVTQLTDAIGIASGEGLVPGADGNFFGTTMRGGAEGFGTIFKMTPKGKLTLVASFDGTNGSVPICLIQGVDGNLYGAAWQGGGIVDAYATVGHGTIFKLTPNGELTALFAFAGTNGDMPISLLEGMDGNLYGITAQGGSTYDSSGVPGFGTVFQLTTNGALTTLCEFDGTNGFQPQALVQARDGNLYGTTYWSGTNGNGSIFRLTTNGAFTTLYSFSAFSQMDQNLDGANPVGRLIQGSDGCLYGGTRNGGSNYSSFRPGLGTLYKITTNGEFFTLASLGESPSSLLSGPFPNGLIQDRKGNFFGTTSGGGTNNAGSIIKLTVASPLLAVTKHHLDNSSNSATVSGKAKAMFGGTITGVLYQLNGGAWTDASTSDSFAHWTAELTLGPGANVFRVYAVDSTGDYSRTNTLRLRPGDR
jgi:uncharacterized repeat protein (TIGR03803 family)